MRQKSGWCAGLSQRVYGWILKLYPRRFRVRFGKVMADDFRRMYEAYGDRHGRWGPVLLWRRVVSDSVRSVAREHREARSTARARGPESDSRDVGGEMGAMMLDVRIAWRTLLRRPGYSVVAIVTLMLAIGANTVLFSVLHGVLLRPLPYPAAERLALLSESDDGVFGNVSYPNYLDWREGTRSFEEMGAFSWTTVSLTGGSEPMRLTAGRADPGFMRAAGLEPMLGRSFLDGDDAEGAAPVVILSHGLWQQNFGADPDILSRVIGLNGSPAEVIGVLPEGADFAEAGTAMWVPLVPSIGDWTERREVHALTVLARRSTEATTEESRLEIGRLGEELALEYPDANAGRGAYVVPLHDALLGDVATAVWLLMGMVVLVLLIGCANVANLLLVRLHARRDELALRRALGAGRWGVTRLLLAESLGLTLAGGALGIGLAYAAIGPAVEVLQGRIPRVDEVALDPVVRLCGFGVSVLSGLSCGALPRCRSGRDRAEA
ncbi:MAG: ABC transporter permease, partial [Gemmatimonadetes bacterium]|nr:ABC transporter permease [Gemmatimonadota bacterium]